MPWYVDGVTASLIKTLLRTELSHDMYGFCRMGKREGFFFFLSLNGSKNMSCEYAGFRLEATNTVGSFENKFNHGVEESRGE